MYKVNRERLLATFIDLVKIPSPSWKEKRVIDYIIKKLKVPGVSFEKYKCGESFNVLARIDGDTSRKTLLFSCHTDTVVPCDSVNPVITGTRVSSDGNSILGADDKAAVAAFLEAIHYLKENNVAHGPLEFLFSCAEEIGLYGIKGFDASILRSKYGFVFDSSGEIGTVIVDAPYHLTLEFTIMGRAAHAGIEPEKGISAIKVLADIISKIPHGRINRGTTVNTGIIYGGKATNIVAEKSFCRLEIRSLAYKKLKAIEARIRDIIRSETKRHGAKAKINRKMEYSGFSISRGHEVVKIVKRAVERLKLKPVFESSGGGSDTNVLNRAGIKSLNLSIGMRNVHTKKEYILIKDLVDGTRLVLSIIDSV